MTESFDKPFCTHCEMRINSIFGELDQDALRSLTEEKGCSIFKRRQLLFKQGARPKGLFCIHRGKIKVYKTGDEGRDHILRFAKAGDILGYRSLLSREAYAASAAALEDSMVCFVPQKTFFGMLGNNETFSMKVIQLLSCELGKAEDKMLKLAQKPVRERLAETLLLLKEIYGTENGDNSPLNVALSREDLANVVGTATETLVRTIADLKRESLIATDKKKIRILDMDGLLEAGNIHD